MIFNLFESRKSKWKKRLIKGFDIYIPGIQGLDAEEIGLMLDEASQIKYSSLMLIEENHPSRAFWEDPTMIEENKCLDRLDFWAVLMLGWSQEGVKGNAKVASFNIYYFSLGAATYADLRIRGKQMWKELSRGFKFCNTFEPKLDIPKGFEQYSQ